MPLATFRFYEELNDYLPEGLRKRDVDYCFQEEISVGAALQSFGIPREAVELIFVNAESVDFSRILADGDRVAVYPMFESTHVGSLLRVRKNVLRKTRFAVDPDLPNLAKVLKNRGADVYFSPFLSRSQLIEVARSERRVLLTRDADWIEGERLTHVIFVRGGDVEEEVEGILSRLDLKREERHESTDP